MIRIDMNDERVVHIAAGFLADDVERLTGIRPDIVTDGSVPDGPSVVAGTVGMCSLVDRLSRDGLIDVSGLGGKWDNFFNWPPNHWFRSTKMDAPVCTEQLLAEVRKSPKPGHIKVEDALSREGAVIVSDVEGDIPLWIHALTPTQRASKKPKDNQFCTVDMNGSMFTASAKPINNIFIGVYPPFPNAAIGIIKASEGSVVRNSPEGQVRTVKGLGFNDGVVVLPFDTPSYSLKKAPAVSFTLDVPEGARYLEIRTLSNLHVCEGRDARYAVTIDRKTPGSQNFPGAFHMYFHYAPKLS